MAGTGNGFALPVGSWAGNTTRGGSARSNPGGMLAVVQG
jgi:hypothetical protein